MNTKETIFEVAFDLFVKKGYTKTTVRAIANRADVNVGLISYYYDNKENLGATVFRTLVKRILEGVDYTLITLDNRIEKLYYGYLMIQYYLNANKKVNGFYVEFLEKSNFGLHLSVTTKKQLEDICKAYGISISAAQLMDYCTALIGAERTMLIKKNRGQLNMTYQELNAVLARIILTLIGLEQKTIDDAIQSVDRKIRTLPYNWKLME